LKSLSPLITILLIEVKIGSPERLDACPAHGPWILGFYLY
jgi:hypothetical protein